MISKPKEICLEWILLDNSDMGFWYVRYNFKAFKKFDEV